MTGKRGERLKTPWIVAVGFVAMGAWFTASAGDTTTPHAGTAPTDLSMAQVVGGMPITLVAAAATSQGLVHTAPGLVLEGSLQSFGSLSGQPGSAAVAQVLPTADAAATVPEPSAYAVLMAGLALVCFLARRRAPR